MLHSGFICFSNAFICAYEFLILDPVSKDKGVSPCPGTLRSRWALVDTNADGEECDSIGSVQFELVGRGDDATDVLLTLAF